MPKAQLAKAWVMTNEQKLLLGLLIVFLGSLLLSKGVPSLGAAIRKGIKWRRPRSRASIQIGKFWVSDEARLRHCHIVGATGAGKTVLIEQLLYQDLKRGNGALIIDPKGDRELYDRVKGFCRRIGRGADLHLLSSTHVAESSRWNPCRLGDVSELQTKFFNAAVYEHSFYAKACELAFLKAFQSLHENSPEGFTLADLAKTFNGLSQGGKDETIKGMYFDLDNLARGEWAELLCASPSSRPEISLLEITRKNEILFVDLPTEAKAVQSSRIGRLLLQELMILSGMRKAYPAIRGERPFSVFIDEFDAFASESFATFLNKGRSSGFMIHLAHQTLSDLKRVSQEFAGQVMGNTNVRFVFRQDDPDDAETWSRFFGTRTTVKKTYQTLDGSQTGAASNREVQEFRVSPDLIKELRTGECIYSNKVDGVSERMKVPNPLKSSFTGIQLPLDRGPAQVTRKTIDRLPDPYLGLGAPSK